MNENIAELIRKALQVPSREEQIIDMLPAIKLLREEKQMPWKQIYKWLQENQPLKFTYCQFWAVTSKAKLSW